jgi:hypothetical protein
VPGEEPLRGTAVGGLDPETGKFVEYCFSSNGWHFINRYPDPGEASDVGVGYGERSGTVYGKDYRGKITVDRTSRNRFVYTVASDGGEDEKPVF